MSQSQTQPDLCPNCGHNQESELPTHCEDCGWPLKKPMSQPQDTGATRTSKQAVHITPAPEAAPVIQEAIVLQNHRIVTLESEIERVKTESEQWKRQYEAALQVIDRINADGNKAYNEKISLQAQRDAAVAALKLMKAHYDDLGRSNPGFMGKLCLQDYGLWNEALIAMSAAIAAGKGAQA